MAKYLFPAIFAFEKDNYSVTFPDIESCYTCGKTFSDAVKMAEDVLSLRLCDIEDSGEQIPVPTDTQFIAHGANEIVEIISCDTIAYRRRMLQE